MLILYKSLLYRFETTQSLIFIFSASHSRTGATVISFICCVQSNPQWGQETVLQQCTWWLVTPPAPPSPGLSAPSYLPRWSLRARVTLWWMLRTRSCLASVWSWCRREKDAPVMMRVVETLTPRRRPAETLALEKLMRMGFSGARPMFWDHLVLEDLTTQSHCHRSTSCHQDQHVSRHYHYHHHHHLLIVLSCLHCGGVTFILRAVSGWCGARSGGDQLWQVVHPPLPPAYWLDISRCSQCSGSHCPHPPPLSASSASLRSLIGATQKMWENIWLTEAAIICGWIHMMRTSVIQLIKIISVILFQFQVSHYNQSTFSLLQHSSSLLTTLKVISSHQELTTSRRDC